MAGVEPSVSTSVLKPVVSNVTRLIWQVKVWNLDTGKLEEVYPYFAGDDVKARDHFERLRADVERGARLTASLVQVLEVTTIWEQV